MIKKQNVGNSVIVLTLSKTMTLILTIVTSMMLSRYLSLQQYGTYAELLTVTSLAVSILSLGLPNCINYFVPQCSSEDEKSAFVNFYFCVITFIAVIIAAVLFLSRDFIAAYYGNAELASYTFFLVVIPWAKMLLSSRSNLLVVDQKVKRELFYSITNAASLLAITTLAIFFRYSFQAYLYLYIAVEFVFTVLVYYEAFKSAQKRIHININWDIIKKVLAFSVPLGLATAISTVSVDLDKLVIGWYMDETAVAIYANAGKELPFSYISASFTAVVLPQVVEKIKNNNKYAAIELWGKSCELCVIFIGFFVAASIVFAPQIITLLYSEKYVLGVGLFTIYSMVMLFRITYWGMLLNATGRTKDIFYNSIFCLALNFVLSILFFQSIGFLGPALASCISIGFMSFMQLLKTAKVINVKIKDMFPWLHIGKTLIICALSGGTAWAVCCLLDLGTTTKDIIIAIVLGCIWAMLYFGLNFKRIKGLWNSFNHTESEGQ